MKVFLKCFSTLADGDAPKRSAKIQKGRRLFFHEKPRGFRPGACEVRDRLPRFSKGEGITGRVRC